MSCYTDITMFKSYIKEFVKKVVDYLEKEGKPKDEVDAFKKKIQGWVVSLLSKDRFKNLQFFIGMNELYFVPLNLWLLFSSHISMHRYVTCGFQC